MICPKCGKTIPDNKTVCPYCQNDIVDNLEFNDYKSDGFVHLQPKEYAANSTTKSKQKQKSKKQQNEKKMSEANIFIVAIAFIALIALITIFGIKNLRNNAEQSVIYTVNTAQTTSTEEVATTKNDVTDLDFSNLDGIWMRVKDQNKSTYVPYFTFSDNSLSIECGTMKAKSTVIDMTTEEEHKIFISSNNVIAGYFYYDVTGNSNDGYTLSLTSVGSTSAIEFVKVNETKLKEVEPPEKKVIDKNLVGMWSHTDNMYYDFNSDGTFSRYNDGLYLNGIWTLADENTLKLTYTEKKETNKYLQYSIYDDKLIIAEDVYRKES